MAWIAKPGKEVINGKFFYRKWLKVPGNRLAGTASALDHSQWRL
jgi:hypothetical protein